MRPIRLAATALALAALANAVPAAPAARAQAPSDGAPPAPAATSRRHLDASIALRAGTLGAGVEVGKLVTSHLAVRGGFYHTPLNLTQTVSDVSYDARLRLGGATVLADFFPSARGTFHLTGGAVFNRTRITGSAVPGAGGTIPINGHEYSSAELGRMTARASFPAVAPYVGIGWGTPARKSAVSLVTDVGVTLGAPRIALDAANPSQSPTLRADLAAQQAKTQAQINRYARAFPVSNLGLVVRF